jgi:hypothetical protein
MLATRIVASGFFGKVSFSAFGGVVQLHKHKIASRSMYARPLIIFIRFVIKNISEI